MKAIPIILLAAATAVALGIVTPAAASWDGHDGRWRPQPHHHQPPRPHHQWGHQWSNPWRHHGYHWPRHHGPHHYSYGYNLSPRVYYAPAPAYYGSNW